MLKIVHRSRLTYVNPNLQKLAFYEEKGGARAGCALIGEEIHSAPTVTPSTPSEQVEATLRLAQPLPLTKHPAAVYLDNLGSDGSRRIMGQALDAIAALLTDGECDAMTLNWAALRYEHAAAVRAALLKRYAPSSANRMLCALRRVLKEALRLKLLGADDYAMAVEIGQIQASPSLRGRALNPDEIVALMEVCFDDPTAAGVRDAALIAILRGSGVRRSELVALDEEDYHRRSGALQVRGGKGKKDRVVYLPTSAQTLVEDWLGRRGLTPGALLYPVHRSGKILSRRMTDQAVLYILQKRAAQAGVEPFSPHDFRRTFISDLLDANVDVVTVQKLVGHASPETVSVYDRRGEKAKRQAVENLQLPRRKEKHL